MDDQLYEAIAELIESTFIFPANDQKPVWVWCDNSEQVMNAPHRRPLLWADADRVHRLRELYETERIRREAAARADADEGVQGE